MIRPSWRAFRRLVTIAAGALAAEAAYAVFFRIPVQEEFDPSGMVGPSEGVPLNLVVVGDSSCTGPGVESFDLIWSWLIAERLAALGYRVHLRSFAASGAKSADVLATQLPQAEALAADLALVAVGTNDVTHQIPLNRLEANLDEIVGRLSRVSRLVFIAGIGDLGTIPRLLPPLSQLAARRGRTADLVQSRVAERHGAIKADLWGAAAEAFRTDPSIFSSDLFHPTSTGHRVWADAAWEAIEPHVGRLNDGA